MKNEIVMQCGSSDELHEVLERCSMVLSLSGKSERLVSSVDIIKNIGVWSDDPAIVPEELANYVNELNDSRMEIINKIESQDNGMSHDEAKAMLQSQIIAEKRAEKMFLRNEALYPCAVIVVADDDADSDAPIKVAIQTAKAVGCDLLEKFPDIDRGIPELWVMMWTFCPMAFLKMVTICMRTPERCCRELLEACTKIMNYGIKPNNVSDRMYEAVYSRFIFELASKCGDLLKDMRRQMSDKNDVQEDR